MIFFSFLYLIVIQPLAGFLILTIPQDFIRASSTCGEVRIKFFRKKFFRDQNTGVSESRGGQNQELDGNINTQLNSTIFQFSIVSVFNPLYGFCVNIEIVSMSVCKFHVHLESSFSFLLFFTAKIADLRLISSVLCYLFFSLCRQTSLLLIIFDGSLFVFQSDTKQKHVLLTETF